MAFRFSRLATSIASRCVDFGIKNVLIPSVGLCVDPWLVANHGLAVTATETARSALEALSDPAHWPRVYSRAAYERWDIATCAAFACIPHPDYFAEMPLLEDAAVRDRLRSRINFLHNDWASIPLESGSVDVVFAANAVPRESAEERTKVLEEWIRVLRPGGVIFISQHHVPMDWNIEQFFNERNLVATDFLGGNCPARNVRAGFQLRYTSG
jgi:SAM-dependent methyltransferase